MDSTQTAETIKRGPGRPPKAVETITEAPAVPAPEPVALFPVTLLKHYRPQGIYEIVGEPAKGPFPGVGFEHKLWAGTTVKLPRDEAIALIENKVSTIQNVVDEAGGAVTRNGRPLRETVTKKFPLAERADAIPA